MAYNKSYYDGKRQKVQDLFNKAQSKYWQMAELLGREYVALQERVTELNEMLQQINDEEKKSQETDKQKGR